MLKKITALLLTCVIMMASVPVNVFSMISNQTKAEENRDVPEVLEDIYYSDLFYGYDVSYLKSTEVMTYAKDTYEIPLDILIDYCNSPGCILTGGYTAITMSPKEMVGLFSELYGTDYTYNKALDAAKALFGGGANTDNMPTTVLSRDDFTDGAVGLIDIMLKAGIIKSRGEGRRLIEQGGVAVDDEKAKSFTDVVSLESFDKGHVIVKKGKKVFIKFIVE